jgi:hypothetical protein
MKTMKLNFRKFLGATAVAAMLFVGASTLTSCGKEGCTDTDANNYNADATDDDGTCTYDRTKFLGAYTVNETCNSGTYNYSMTIAEASANMVTVTLTNLGDFSSNVLTGTVSGDALSIPSQTLTIQGTSVAFSGQGTISGSTLTIIYGATYNGTTDNCTATCIKQ